MVEVAVGDAFLCVVMFSMVWFMAWLDEVPRQCDGRLQEGQKAPEAGDCQPFHDGVNEVESRVVRCGGKKETTVQLERNTNKIPLLFTQCLRRDTILHWVRGKHRLHSSIKIKEISMLSSFVWFPELRAEMLDKKSMWGFATANVGVQDCNPRQKRKEILRAWTVDPKHFCTM